MTFSKILTFFMGPLVHLPASRHIERGPKRETLKHFPLKIWLNMQKCVIICSVILGIVRCDGKFSQLPTQHLLLCFFPLPLPRAYKYKTMHISHSI